MRRLSTQEPVWDLYFDEAGGLTAPAATTVLGELAAEGVDDLFVFSHGWGTSEGSARRLCDAMFPLIREAAAGASGLGRVGFAGVYWPSLWFPPTPATPAGQGGAIQAGGAVTSLSAGTTAVSGAEIADALRPGFAGAQQDIVTEIGRRIDDGVAAVGSGETDEVKEERIRHIHRLLQSLVPPADEARDSAEDGGEGPLISGSDPRTTYQGVASTFGSAPAGSSAQGFGDWFSTAIQGAKDATRVFSFTIMKARAGDIGRNGLGPLLARMSNVRVHLIGHSFGARLVSFALAGIDSPQRSPVASLMLVQGAFSHWSFAHEQDNPFGRAGALHAVADRVHGPLVATYSVHDWAVGVWYPRASFLSRQDTQSVAASRWGGMGADGYQAVSPLEARSMPATGGNGHDFKPHTFYRVNAAAVINDVADSSFGGAHSDIRKPAIAELIVSAAAAHA